MKSMDEAYKADHAHKRLCDEARRAVEAVLESEIRMSRTRQEYLRNAANELRNAADHVVRVWD